VSPLRVAVVGATGIAGQQFVACLQDHPWFKLTALAASGRSAGKSYGEALTDASGARRWWCQEKPSLEALALPVQDASQLDARAVDIVFTAVEAEAARELEPLYARTTAVISTASAFRNELDVPLVVPGVNFDHLPLIQAQRRRRGWKGFIVPTPNCTATGLVVTLKPLHQRFGVRRVFMTSMQGVSGAGRSPGVIGLDIIDNIIPYIPSEEEKVERETRKILGRAGEGGVELAPFSVSCTCTRAAVLEGHTESVFVSLERKASLDEVSSAFASFGAELASQGLPSAPKRMIVLHRDPYRPQPRLDRDAEGGMATSVGRLREDATLENGIKYVLVSHNTKMGAAKGCVMLAEHLVKAGYIS
jgi:aspartate-semialdehyde dehydrogenase